MRQEREQEKIIITVNDYKQMCGVIDVASTRGAFRANELAGVGILHNRLLSYIQQNEPQSPMANGPTVITDKEKNKKSNEAST